MDALEKWKPRDETRKIISFACKFASSEKPVTVRQTFYHLVSNLVIPNTEADYHKVVRILTKARKAGIIPFEWFVDRSRRSIQVPTYSNIKEFLQQKVKHYYLDTWQNQKVFIMAWIEKEALVGVVSRVTIQFNVPLFVGKGYSSWSNFLEAFKIVEEHAKSGKGVIVLYLGDYDPSGVDIFRDLKSRFEKLGVTPYFEKLALTEEQIVKFKLPPMPLKKSDPRTKKFQKEHENFAVELDALPPRILREIVLQGIIKYLDLEAFEGDQRREKEEKMELERAVEAINKKQKGSG